MSVPGLRGSAMLEVCVDLYVAHHDDGVGRCHRCGVPLMACVPRRNAAKVLSAAGLDPVRFDTTSMWDRSAYVRSAFGWGGR